MNEKRAAAVAERLFTGKRRLGCRLNDGELPEGFKDAIHTEVRAVIAWRGRLRVLFGAHLIVDQVTYCENPPGRLQSHSEIHFVRPRRPRTAPAGFVAAAPENPA